MRKINVKKIQRANDRKAEDEQFKKDLKEGGKNYAIARVRIREKERKGKGVVFLLDCLRFLGAGLLFLAFIAFLALV